MTTATSAAQTPIADFLATTALAPRQAHKALTVWPLVRRDGAAAAAGFVPLARALEAGWLEVGEVSQAGSVPHARVANRGGEAVLVLFGEELVGAKQNRIANASFLIPARSEVVIDVSCVEHGRWGRVRRDRFGVADALLSAKLRRKMSTSVRMARAAGGGFRADQGEVWDEVAERVSFSRADAPTAAYADYYRSRRTDVEEIARAFHAVPGQVGFVAAAGDEILGLEAIGSPVVFQEVFARLLRGYAIDAVDVGFLREREAHGGPRPPAPRFDAPEPFLAAVAAAPVRPSPSLGLGTDLRVEGDELAGCALVDGTVVHLTAYPAEVA
jgi:hypothetical protein